MQRFVLCLFVLFAGPVAAQDMGALIAAARSQIGVTVGYDPAYVALDYPGGDVAQDRGVCTDVLIRAFRSAWGIDLQRVVHKDMQREFAAYPTLWNLTRPDANIDHRRVPNLQAMLARAGAELEISADPVTYLPGDIVSWRLPGNLPHIGIVSDKMSDRAGQRLVLHNIGGGAQEDDLLMSFPITGHYRVTDNALAWMRALDR